MGDIYPYVLVSILCSIAVFGAFLGAIQSGWVRLDVQNRPLRDRIAELENEIRSLIEQREMLFNELTSARRMIETLEDRIKSVEVAQRKNERVKVLAIWPKTGTPLDQDGERCAIYDAGIDYKSLSGERATRASIVQELRRERYTIIEIGAHGGADGAIELHDGAVTPGWWYRAMQDRGIGVALLLVCFSEDLADSFLRARVPVGPLWLRLALKNSTNRDVYAYLGPVPFPVMQMQVMNAAAGSGITWGQVWWQIHSSRGAGPDDRIMVGGIDYSAAT